MSALSIQTEGKEMVIRLNKDSFSESYLLSLVRRLYVEELAQKAEVDETLLEIAEDIDQRWWAEHGKAFLEGVEV